MKSGFHLNWEQTFETFDHLIKAGHIQQVAAMLSEVHLKKIPRVYAQKVAHYFYRTGLFSQGLQILAPIVYPKRRMEEGASEKEISTYAILLIKIGSVQEAKKLLLNLSSQTPEADLYRAFAEQAEWDYEKAIPHLRNYLRHPNLTDYERAVAEVNLSAALIDMGHAPEAETLLSQLTEKCRQYEWVLLQKNCRELLGQLAMLMNDFAKAHLLLEQAASMSGQRDSGIFDFLIDKWQALLDLKQNPSSFKAQEGVRSIRERACNLRHWESVRECDRSLAFALKDAQLFHRVFFGTRFPAYRRKLLKEAEGWITPPSVFIWGSADGQVLDLLTAQTDDGQLLLKTGKTLHRLLMALAADHYRPLYVGQLFALTYPNESFIAEFSEGRVSAAVSRLRKWAEDHQLPLHIEVKDQFYRLEIHDKPSAFGIRYLAQVETKIFESPMESNLLRLQTKIDGNEFSSRQIAEALGVSKSSAVRWIDWALQHGKLKSFGNNKTTKYRFIT